MRSIKTKKAQSSLGVGTIIAIIVLLIVGVVVVLGATGGLNSFFNLFDQAPLQDLERVAQSCVLASQGGLVNDYCDTFKDTKISGESQTRNINCQYSAIAQRIENPISCNGNKAAEQCARLKSNLKFKGIYVNDVYCSSGVLSDSGEITCTSLNGAWKDSCLSGETDKTTSVNNKADFISGFGKKCCEAAS
ncbi:MAG: hypothetical protein AABX03_01720 [Nanoarchaeota archaeon]